MRDAALHVVVALNQIANAIGEVLLAPLKTIPEIPGAIVVAVLTGILMLIGFKYTSRQTAIKRVRDDIKAEMLALSLFRDSVPVNLKSQWQIVLGAVQLIGLSLVPIACMAIPVTLLLGQLSLWWQARPVQVGEYVVVTLALNSGERSAWHDVTLQTPPGIDITQGPFRIRSKKEMAWQLQAKTAGYHKLEFVVNGQTVTKELAVGSNAMRVSIERPEWNLTEVLLHPAEAPFSSSSDVKSIRVQYPLETIWTHGPYAFLWFHSWLGFWFIGSTIAALCLRRVL
ncbi:MAG: hypothetical protein KDB01_08355, partial [Planctomycetaceae bacterium]|nr:hypothetical protein [Planctomycetaceae bacterium]